MIESVHTAIQVVETLKKKPFFEAKYRTRINTFRDKLLAQQAGKGTLTPDVLVGVLSGILFTQKAVCAYDLTSHPIHEMIIVATGAIAELLVDALEP